LSALIARLAEPKFNLAAYGVSYSFALIIEAPVIMMMSASTALVKDYQSFIKLRNFNTALSIIITSVMLILLIPQIFYLITEGLINLPKQVADLTYYSTIILLPWPAAIGYRRFYQGILIRNNLTRRVAYGTAIRLISMAATAFVLFLFTDVPGVIVGASSLSAAVILEALSSRVMANSTVNMIKQNKPDLFDNISYSHILKFYYPLALTSLISLGVQPLVTFFVGQSTMPLESLAVLPVITSFVFIFRAFGLSYQEVVITFWGRSKNANDVLKKFAAVLGLLLTLSLGIIAYTPLSDVWFIYVSGLSDFLSEFSKLPTMIMTILPALTLLISFQRATLISRNNTKPVTIGTLIEFLTILTVLYLLIGLLSFIGVIGAAIAFVTGRILANTYLATVIKRN
ncbi:MAG: hypothetical protein R3321_12190, partial [Nitrososphaeraceae archaeon]|nr:hypothetical protein [Nitrososphaeraceae archaeon]